MSSEWKKHAIQWLESIAAMDVSRIVRELEARRTGGDRHLLGIIVRLSKKWIAAKANRKEDESLVTRDTELGHDTYVCVDIGDRTIAVMDLLLQAKLQNINLPRSLAESILTEALRGKSCTSWDSGN